VVGAGLTLGRLLENQAKLANQAKVVVFEKSRNVSGRMASCRSGEVSFDHGAQFFTAHELAGALQRRV
jgi:renalase